MLSDFYLESLETGTLLASITASLVLITVTIFYTTPNAIQKTLSFKEKGQENRHSTSPIISGLFNEGNTCFMNSVLQSVASLDGFTRYLQSRLLFLDRDQLVAQVPVEPSSSKYKNFYRFWSLGKGDGEESVTEALQQLTDELSICGDRRPISKTNLVNALASKGELRHLYGYNQQDAHEFFIHLSSKVTEEELNFNRIPSLFDSSVILQDASFEEKNISGLYGNHPINWKPKKMKRNPFIGLTVNVIICQSCGYHSPSQHEAFYNLSITVPTSEQPTIISMLKTYTSPEIIDEYLCRKCSFLASQKKIQSKIEQGRLLKGLSTSPSMTHTIKKEIQNFLEIKAIIDNAVKSNSFEPKGFELVKIMSIASKRVTLASAPSCLCFHMQRSVYFPETGHIMKNNASVSFDETLDLNYFFLPQGIKGVSRNDFKKQYEILASEKKTASSKSNEQVLSTIGDDFAGNIPNSQPMGPFVYRLAAVILHYGDHDSGHFVTLRKVSMSNVDGVDEDYWFRVSDASVEKITDVKNEVFIYGRRYAYMLFYEKSSR